MCPFNFLLSGVCVHLYRCQHYFCEKCILAHHKTSGRCPICQGPTQGMFKPAKGMCCPRLNFQECCGLCTPCRCDMLLKACVCMRACAWGGGRAARLMCAIVVMAMYDSPWTIATTVHVLATWLYDFFTAM